MQPGLCSTPLSVCLVSVLYLATLVSLCLAAPLHHLRRDDIPLILDYSEAPAPEDGPPLSAGALRGSAYLPAQIGGIVGSYALSLVIVAILLLVLSKKRRAHLAAAEEDAEEPTVAFAFAPPQQPPSDRFPYPVVSPRSPINNFSWPTPNEGEKRPNPYVLPSSPQSTSTLGVNPLVDQKVVAADRMMAQQQLEEMYKYVMEQDEAKQAGVVLDEPPAPLAQQGASPPTPKSAGFLRKSKTKPANLDLAKSEPEKQSRASSLLSALKSPGRKKAMKGISISSPIMTPQSSTFPPQEGEEMDRIPPRQYAPAPPPPVPTDQAPYLDRRTPRHLAPITPPDVSPESTMSIDERIDAQMGRNAYSHSRQVSQAPSEMDPVSAASERSSTPLVGLPSSPKPGVNRFPTLPASPKPGATFSRANAPSAVRTGGALPLRAYEPSLASPSTQTTKQTVFERAPLSPSALRTPWTGAPVPYSPYQPQTPCVPITPSLVTKADRKRMKSMQPKTPTLNMVQSSEDIW